jgi:hypothetical protein
VWSRDLRRPDRDAAWAHRALASAGAGGGPTGESAVSGLGENRVWSADKCFFLSFYHRQSLRDVGELQRLSDDRVLIMLGVAPCGRVHAAGYQVPQHIMFDDIFLIRSGMT